VTTWTDQVIEHISADYAQSVSWLYQAASPGTLRLVERLLEEDHEAQLKARSDLGYDVDSGHLAAVLHSTADDAEQVLRSQAAALKQSAPGPSLAVAVDQATVWFWAQIRGGEAAPEIAAQPGVHVSVGRRLTGPDGFRVSHQQALDVDRLARVTGRLGVTNYDAVQVAALAVADIPQCRRFVTAELGRLAHPAPSAAASATVARQTLRVFLEEGSNYRSTARRLGVHHNTVIYRLQQAEKALGRAVGERPLALSVALHLHEEMLTAQRRE